MELVAAGVVFGEDKRERLTNALALVNPSRLDNLSIAVCEAWAAAIPVLVNADSPVVKALCGRAAGGIVWGNAQQFAAAVNYLTAHPTDAEQMGRSGQAYVLAEFGEARVKATLHDCINHVTTLSAAT